MRKHLLLVLVLMAASAVHADLLVNGGFEYEPNINGGNGAFAGDGGFELMTGSAIPGWTIAPGYAATIHFPSYLNYEIIDGNYSLNTDGEGYNGNNTLIYQDFASTAGQTFNLSFKWATWNITGHGPASLEIKVFDTANNSVLFDGIYPDTVTPYAVQNVTTTLTGTGNSLQLQIDENPQSGYNDNEFIVDDFSVTPVPEPSTLALGGLASLFLLLRRKRV
jgi:hypothetical protein